ncbi:sugar nucleotide-binding protein [Methylobacterium radiodurans]|uniref:dTDP-4-dehydrorhamnose reductase n=1 Tax=Methylobacterium radiodurans TaxID=2202828 RepID=A0A2U8VUX9_9HYPH|nr:sugar nucleotide-binding protein [Methylobacterium radiodurans]AWN37160.1 dTDP-4-dehydrorhamnose reductase [Methylobacterium radiodurans]
MLEVWGGVECSVVRIRNAYRDQVAETGHRDRPEDLDAIAALGIRTLRYPILWESVAPDDPETCDWSWHDARLARLRALGIDVIAGLVHHGSGPRYTSLADPNFPALLAQYAGRVAARYPWIERFTPVNEPLTTARFAGLYGHWYPHRRSEAEFLRMMFNQCRATLLALRAIRAVTPGAHLIQTEDVGRTFSTPALAEQAAYENERRWLSLDLLCGRLDPTHPWFERFLALGLPRAELEAFLTGEARPALIGVNHYLTSERYLDERTRAYPRHLRGGNGRRRYADAEAVRLRHLADRTGPKARLDEVWARYGQALAVTEVHHGCSRDDQLRWLSEVWQAAVDLRREQVPVEAVTVWSLFGAVDWNTLLVARAGHYEPGAFDIRAPQPRLTALGQATRELAATGGFRHPVLAAPGWWRRECRFYASERGTGETAGAPGVAVLQDGAGYAEAIARICAARGLRPVILDEAALPEALARPGLWALIDPTPLPLEEMVLRYPGGSFRAGIRTGALRAGIAARADLRFLTVSSALVFEGQAGRPLTEDDPVQPCGPYGHSAAEREAQIRAAHPGALVVRTGPVFGLSGEAALRLLPDRPDRRAWRSTEADLVSPAYLPDLVHAALDLLIDGESGIWHLAHAGATTWAGLAHRLARAAGLPQPAPEPAGSGRIFVLASVRGSLMPALDSAVARCAEALLRPGPGRCAAE